MKQEILALADRLAQAGEPFALATVVWARAPSSGKPGATALITADRKVTGWIGGLATLPAEQAPPHLRWPGNLDQHWTIDTARIREELGYREPIAREEAIRRTIEWERANPPPVDPRAFDYGAEDAAWQQARQP